MGSSVARFVYRESFVNSAERIERTVPTEPLVLIVSDEADWEDRLHALASSVLRCDVTRDHGPESLLRLVSQLMLGVRAVPDLLVVRCQDLSQEEAEALRSLAERGIGVIVVASDDELGAARDEMSLGGWPPWSGMICIDPRDRVVLPHVIRRSVVVRRPSTPAPRRPLLSIPPPELVAILERHADTLED